MKKTFYTGEAVRRTITNLTAAGGTARTFYSNDGQPAHVITKAGYKTLVFLFQGTHDDGRSLYSLKKYNTTPKKYQ